MSLHTTANHTILQLKGNRMSLKNLHKWLSRKSATAQQQRRKGSAKPRRRHFRPVLETLEDRRVLSTIQWVNRNSDGLYGNGFTNLFGADAELAKRDVDAALLAWQNVIQD